MVMYIIISMNTVGNLTYSPALICVIVFYVIYYACTVLRISYIADYVLRTLYVIGQFSLIPISYQVT